MSRPRRTAAASIVSLSATSMAGAAAPRPIRVTAGPRPGTVSWESTGGPRTIGAGTEILARSPPGGNAAPPPGRTVPPGAVTIQRVTASSSAAAAATHPSHAVTRRVRSA